MHGAAAALESASQRAILFVSSGSFGVSGRVPLAAIASATVEPTESPGNRSLDRECRKSIIAAVYVPAHKRSVSL